MRKSRLSTYSVGNVPHHLTCKADPMTLGLTQEHAELAAAVRGWAERNCPPDLVRAAADSDDGGAEIYRSRLSPALASQGLLGLHLAERDGGQGYGLSELAVATEELGRALVPGAFVPTVLAAAVLAEAGGPGKLLAGLADGSVTGAVSLEPGLTATRGPGGELRVSGETGPVLAGSPPDLVIARAARAAADDGAEVWVALDAAGLSVTQASSVDLVRPLASVRAEDLAVPPDRVLTGIDTTAVTSLAAIVFGAEASGIADWAVQVAADYAKIRHQFGRPIGQFQAVKHRCARMLTGAEQAAAVVWDAARTEPGQEREFAAAVAAVVAIDAAVDAANDCIQTLGGIGYTWEHEAHLYYRRALALRSLLGSSLRWRELLARLALAGRLGPAGAELPEGDEEFRHQVRSELAAVSALTGPERVAALADGGWVLPHLPRPWGRGAAPLEQLIIAAELRTAGVRPHDLAIGAWVAPALIQYGTQEQQDRFLPATMRLDYLWCQLFSEPGAGSDLAALSTRAVRADGGWLISGQKIWTSLAQHAAWGICIARTDPSAPKHAGISYFLVDMKAPGVQVRPLREITGEASFNQVFLDDVFVPDDCLVGQVNQGWRVARTTLANEELALGDLGRLAGEGRAIELLGLRVTLKRISGTEPGATGSVRKLLAMRNAQQVAELCLAVSGPSGALGAEAAGDGSPVRNGGPNGAYWARQTLAVRAVTIGGGTTDIQLNIIAERMLGLPRDP